MGRSFYLFLQQPSTSTSSTENILINELDNSKPIADYQLGAQPKIETPDFSSFFYLSTPSKKNSKLDDRLIAPLYTVKHLQDPDYEFQLQSSSEEMTSNSYSTLGKSEAQIWPNFLWRNHFSARHCIPIQVQVPEKVDLLQFQLLFTVLYFVVWFSAIFGNLSVIYVVTLKQVKMSSVRSVFICSLAISDVVLSLTSLPITAVSIFTRDWVFPKLFCNLIGVFQGGSVFVSSFTLTAIAVDRYILVKHPASEKINVNNAVLIVFFVWIIGYLFALPVGIFSATANYRPFCGLFCDEFWPDSDDLGVSQMRKSYGILVLIIQFGLPVAISSLCYWTIGKIIAKQLVKRKQQQIIFQANQDRLESRKNRSNRMMLSMVFGLVLAWLPMNLINLWRDFDNAERNSEWYSLIFAGCHVTAMTSAVWNPIIYSWFNPQFKETLRKVLERRRRRSLEAAQLTNAQASNVFLREQSAIIDIIKSDKSECKNHSTNVGEPFRSSSNSLLLAPSIQRFSPSF